jgi:hypothetical protein
VKTRYDAPMNALQRFWTQAQAALRALSSLPRRKLAQGIRVQPEGGGEGVRAKP